MRTKTDTVSTYALTDAQNVWGRWGSIGWVLIVSTLCVIGLFWETIEKMVDVWAHSRTFAHGFLVLPVTGYLIWSHRKRWINLEAYPSVWGIGVVMLTVCVWVLGYAADLTWLRQIAVVAMFPGLILTLLGREITKTLAWPLAFLLFMVPFGTSIEPWLQDITTWFIRVGLKLAGVQFLAQTHRFILTTGIWNVDPDCAGLRYLLPGLALGYAFVTLMYRRSAHRLLFLIFCACVLVFANGVRAYSVIIGDHFGIADGTDHRVFSYAVYGVTMPLLLWLGLRWQDTNLDLPKSPHQATHMHEGVRTRAIVMGIAALAILALAPLSVWLWNTHQ